MPESPARPRQGRQALGLYITDEFRDRLTYLARRQAGRESQATGRPPRPNMTRALEAAVYAAWREERRLEAAEQPDPTRADA